MRTPTAPMVTQVTQAPIGDEARQGMKDAGNEKGPRQLVIMTMSAHSSETIGSIRILIAKGIRRR